MKKTAKLLALASLGFLVAVGAEARNSTYHLDIKDVYQLPEAKEKLDPKIKLYFGQSVPGSVVQTSITNKKTNAFGKSDEVACRWAMLSAMIQLQKKAKQLGVTKVANIESYYKKNSFKSRTKYECHAGAVIAGVALKASFVK